MSEIKRNDRISIWNIVVIVVALGLISRVFYLYTYAEENFIPEYFILLAVGIPALILIFQYRQLRKWLVFGIWVIISVFLLYLSIKFREDARLILTTGKNASIFLQGPFLFLLNYLFFNQLSLRCFSTQLTLPPRGSRYDDEDERYVNVLDYIAFFC
jgi:hypothetical protein